MVHQKFEVPVRLMIFPIKMSYFTMAVVKYTLIYCTTCAQDHVLNIPTTIKHFIKKKRRKRNRNPKRPVSNPTPNHF